MLSQELALITSLDPLITQTHNELIQLSKRGEWATQSAFVIQLPGIGALRAMVVLSATLDISRFGRAKDLVGYSGLGASRRTSGQLVRKGSITKQRRRELRTVLVEAAWIAVEQPGFWKEKFERLESRVERGKAIVAIARKLLVVIWHLLSKQQADRQAKAEQVGCKLLLGGYRLKKVGRQGLSGPQFVPQELDRLGLGQDLTQLKRGGIKLKIPPPPPLKVAAVN